MIDRHKINSFYLKEDNNIPKSEDFKSESNTNKSNICIVADLKKQVYKSFAKLKNYRILFRDIQGLD